MALGRAFSVAVRGLEGEIVEIEADIASGLPGVHLVGLPDTALQESRDRVRAAITNCGNEWPQSRITLALSPATLPKMGSVYDLALAAAVLSAHAKKEWPRLEKTLLLGELALDGRVRPVKGVLPAVVTAKRAGLAHGGGTRRQPARGQPGRRHRGAGRANTGAAPRLAGGQGSSSRSGSRRRRLAARAPDGSGGHRRADPRQVCRRGRRRRRAPPDADRSTWGRENDAGATSSGAVARVVAERVARGHRDPLGGRTAVGGHAADHPSAVRRAAPHLERGRAGRRRIGNGPTGRRQPGPPRCALPRRVRRDRQQRARSAANSFGGRRDSSGAPRRRSASIRHVSSWCSRPTRARVRHPIRRTASAPRRQSAGI